jgi:dTDP-4-amino-4,6-dideoxygalactose transaminase
MIPIPFLQPTFPSIEELAEDYAAILASGTFTNGGVQERRLATALADWIGGDIRVSVVSSATSGLELVGVTCFRPDRRLVLVPSFTFPAGPHSIRWCGLQPFFIDIDAPSWQPDVGAAASVLARHAGDVAGILLTATFGVANTSIGRWEELASHYAVPLVIDMASGFGSRYVTGERAGARGTCEVFSLHATKTLAVGEGGAVASRDHALIERIDRAKNFGFDDDRAVHFLGTNAKLPELSCAIGCRQMTPLPRRLERRQLLYRTYVQQLSPLGLEFQPAGGISALAFVPALARGTRERDALLSALEQNRIGCRAYYNPPVHEQPFFQDAPREGDLGVTRDFASRVISLPMSDALSIDDIRRIASVVRQVSSRG